MNLTHFITLANNGHFNIVILFDKGHVKLPFSIHILCY